MKAKRFKINAISLSIFLAYALTPYSEAALVRDDVDYQIFRDFAENKGKFFVGATDLSVKNKQGQNIGNALSNVPMIDFNVADVNKRIATVVDPQYAVSVKHAKAEVHTFYYGQYNGHNDVADKENEYRVVEQNNYEPHKAWGASNLGRLEDYNMARFNKFVTEVAPIAPTDAGGGLDTYKDKNRFSSFVRIGAGRQLVYEKGVYHQEGNEKGYDLRDLSQAYRYAIAGTPYKDINIDQTMNTEGLIGFGNHNKQYSAEELKQALSQDALTNYGVLGDSGSPLFAFDKQKNQWVFLGTYDYWAGYGKKSWQEWNIYKKEFADKIKQHDNAGTVKGNGEHHWKTTGTNSHIGSTAVRLANNEGDANNGQNVTFEDNGTLVLDQNINQGAGGLFFKGDYTVKGANNDITWLGAGIDVADGKKVVWQVKNPNGDRLAKIGKGTLEINGTGVNQGQLKVGDGTVILNQKADADKKVQAFSQVGIVSGRGTLVLNSSNQINPDNLYFGFRGGRLDANGNDLTFEHIRNVDEGARIVNHNTDHASTITLTGKSLITNPNSLSVHSIQNDYDEDDYSYYYRPRRPIPQGKDLYYKNYRYYALKSGGSVNAPMPENGQTENNDWILMGSTQEEAKKNAMNHKNNQRISGFSGFFGEENGKGHNGALNLNFNGKSAQNRFLLTGGANLNGKISVTQGNVLLSGRPTPHARDFVNKSSARKDAHFSKNNEVVFEDDWINRTFKAAEIAVNQSASFSSGRNVSDITANITATDNAKVNLGYKNGDEVCVRSDYTGYVTCNTGNLSDKALNSFDATRINGNVNLNQNAALVLGKAALWGKIQGQGNSRVSLNQHSKWHLTGDSQVHNLSLADSHIHLNNASDAQSANKYHTIKINHLSGNGHFHYLTDLAKNLGDKVLVKKSASGHYQLHVQNKTGEPNQERLDLFDASSVQDRSRLFVSLANHYVDLGALRYTIKTENGITRLYNPYAGNRRPVKPAPSPAANTASQAQKATQTDGAQIAKPQNIVVAPPSPQANQAEEALRQQAKAEQVKRQQAEAGRKSAELSAKQRAGEEERRQTAQSQPQRRKRRAAPQDYMAVSQDRPKRRGRRSTLPAPPSPSFDSSAYAAPRALHNPDWYENDYEGIPLDALEDEDVSESVDTSDKQPQDNTELHEKVEAVSLQPRAAQPRTQAAAQADAVSTNTNSALSDTMASTQSILLDTGASLTRHIAQKSRADAEKNSVWMSNTGYGRDYASAQYRRFSSKRTQTQIGIDRSLSENMQIGGVLTYSDSQHTFDQAGGKNTFVQANLYGKYYLNDAWYVAGDIGAGSLRSRLQTQQKANFNRTSIQTGLTLGNTLKINQFEIVPSAGIRYSRLSSADYKLGDDSVKVSSMAVKTLTAGLDFAYRFKVGNLTVKPLLSAAYFANYGKGGVNVGGKSFAYKADNQQQYSAGAALLYRNVTLNVNGSITKGKQLEKQKSGQIKIQIRF
ncbi:TPA: autotransporter domain-containing protein [Neisseria gonorrhoeae]